MKIILFNPPRTKDMFSDRQRKLCENTVVQIGTGFNYPVEFGYMSSMLKAKGFEVAILDAQSSGWSEEDSMKFIKKFGPDIIGIPTETYAAFRCPIPFFPHVTITVDTIKRAGIKSKIIVWGPHGTIFPHDTLKKTGADIIIRGEPEKTFLETIINIKRLGSIRGISYTRGSKFIDNDEAEPVNLNELPIPDYESLRPEKYFDPTQKIKGFFLVMASRGCPYNCIYCGKDIYGKYRERDIEKIIRELELLKKRGVNTFYFTDEIFTLKKKRVVEICDVMIKKNFNMKWCCQTRPELLDEELIKKMKEAGCYWIGIGFESASNKILKNVNKLIDPALVVKCIKLGKKHKVQVNLFTMSFLPGETKESLKETLKFVKTHKPQILSTTISTPIPGTALWKMGLETGILKKGDWKECLEKAGQIGTNFSKDEIANYSKVFTTELSLQALKMYKIKQILKRPPIVIHYFKRFAQFLKYKVTSHEK